MMITIPRNVEISINEEICTIPRSTIRSTKTWCVNNFYYCQPEPIKNFTDCEPQRERSVMFDSSGLLSKSIWKGLVRSEKPPRKTRIENDDSVDISSRDTANAVKHATFFTIAVSSAQIFKKSSSVDCRRILRRHHS